MEFHSASPCLTSNVIGDSSSYNWGFDFDNKQVKRNQTIGLCCVEIYFPSNF